MWYSILFEPDNVLGILMGAFWAGVLGLMLYRREKRRPGGRWWWKLFLAGLLARLAAGLIHIAVGLGFYGGAVDFLGYHRRGTGAGQAILGDLEAWSYYRWDAFLYDFLPALLYFFTGPGLVGMFLLSGIVGFGGSYLFLKAFQVALPNEADTRFLGLSLFLLPSLVFWASLLGKDSWVFFFLGCISYAFAHLVRRLRLRYVLGIAGSIAILIPLRPQVAGVMALTVGSAYFASFLSRRAMGPVAVLRPVFVAGSALLVVTVFLTIVPRSLDVEVSAEGGSVEQVVNAVMNLGARKQFAQATDPSPSGSGSNIVPIYTEVTPEGVLRALPFAVFTALFRPVIFEAHNPMAVGAALETTFLMGLILWRRRNLGAAIKAVFARPFIGFCMLSFILLILAVSFGGNLGAIARHRTMALPFLLGLLAVSPKRKRSGRILLS
jgi:hypothetical protein